MEDYHNGKRNPFAELVVNREISAILTRGTYQMQQQNESSNQMSKVIT